MIKLDNPTPKRKPFLRPQIFICIFLISVTLIAFWQVRNNDFINLDDNLYIIDNPFIQQGLTVKGIRWAFMSAYSGHWHPVAWLSHMVDYSLCGLNPRGHHMTNLLLHIANALLLFLLLQRMTGKTWQSCFVAALFAIHPLHVESVAWVAERKDLLCAFFWMLTIWVYVRYVEKPTLHRYLWIILCFMLALMSKPMAVTLPFTLLLLDYWPLGRFKLQKGRVSTGSLLSGVFKTDGRGTLILSLVSEKFPLFLIATAAGIFTIFVHLGSGAISSFDNVPLGIRIENALVSYISYLAKMLWPESLTILYPHPMSLPISKVAAVTLLLVMITIILIWIRTKHPYGIVGWLWYLGTLVPVIGLVQAGIQAMADRFTYLPLIGIFIIFAYGVPDILSSWHHQRVALAISGGSLLLILVMITICQVHRWENSVTLFDYALSVTPDNALIHNNLGVTLMRQGRDSEAILHYSRALEIKPNYADAQFNMGIVLSRLGKTQAAIVALEKAIQLNPNSGNAHLALAKIYLEIGRRDLALQEWKILQQIDSNLANGLY
jgi:protein O-mannosyl-transferase